MKLNSDTLLSFGVFGLGLVAIGYTIGVHSRMKAVADKCPAGYGCRGGWSEEGNRRPGIHGCESQL